MGNLNIITDKDGNILGQADMGFASFGVVTEIAKKYNPDLNLYQPPLFKCITPTNVNDIMEKCYDSCEEYERVQLMTFMCDKRTFTTEDIPAFEEAYEKCFYKEEERGPRKILRFIKELLEKYGEVRMEYQSTYTAMAVTEGETDASEDV